ncbi:hypothetical protein CDL12_02274 [Handroanthus impetiginosus]|uniref:Agenet domain-containing protein n=1 Tax=Handroanthus impetiginosus TaxID=429701 RepID=A0A2G9I5E6_9LAMI|nr:hypothetical protein CDL12_02274 [Handroanthus impetiginosus]
MQSVRRDIIARYFKKGADVEISSNEEGFSGSWYAGTVIQPPGNTKKNSAKVLVEYKTLMEDESGKRRLREKLELVQLRPPPPRESRSHFEFSDEVDAYYNDGWWEGIITKVVGEDKYLVFFRGTREQMAFRASELRLHREWVYGEWVPPLDTWPDATPMNEELPSPAEVEVNREMVEHNFNPGERVEISSDEEGFEGAWFAATVLEKLEGGMYLVEYETLRNADDDAMLLREEVDSLHMRPFPPDVGLVDRFEVLEKVDVWYNEGWWVGVISKVLKNDRYSVYFSSSQEEWKFKHSDLRVHQEWINGEWVIAPQVLFANN